MFFLLACDKHIVLVFPFFFGAIAESRYAVAVLLVREPFAFISTKKSSRNDLLTSHCFNIVNKWMERLR